MAESTVMKISIPELISAVDKVVKNYNVAALTKKDGNYLYDFVKSGHDIELNYKPTVLSPKKFFFPQNEVFLEYTPDGEKITPVIESSPMVLFGIRPCDLNGIKILDEAFSESEGDPNYLAKREKAIIIGMDCKKTCDENSFCWAVKSQTAEKGFDIMLLETEGEYLVKIATDKGKEFSDKYLTMMEASDSASQNWVTEKEESFKDLKPFKNFDRLPEIFEENKDHEVWAKEGEKCLSCGSCIMVCPTCYCFDVAYEIALNLKKGQNIRRWDACMLNNFAEVGHGENFREEPKNRLKHRISRKFNWLMKKHGQAVCVGCGRCVRACLAEISPKKIVENLNP